MVQKNENKQEQSIYAPYYYPNFSRYNFPSDEDKYTEPKFSFPRWDDEVQPYTPPTPLLRRRASSPFSYSEDIDYFNNKLLSDNNNLLDSNTTMTPMTPSDTSDSEEDESETVCDEIQSDIDLARKDQKSDYDQFRKTYATFHDDIRAIQREIEAIEAICMKNVWDLKRGGATINDDGTEIYYEPPCNNNIPTNPTNNIKEGRLASIPSAAAAARSLIGKKRSSPSILYRKKVNNQHNQQEQQQNSFNDNNNNNNSNNRSRCSGIEDGGWLQDRVHQNEGIRC